jgi:hypothetical protein
MPNFKEVTKEVRGAINGTCKHTTNTNELPIREYQIDADPGPRVGAARSGIGVTLEERKEAKRD